MDSIPDATTVAFFRERLRKVGLIEAIFEDFECYLPDQRYEVRGAQIIKAMIVPVPGRRNSRSENKDIKDGKVPEGCQESPECLRQKDLDSDWTKKNGVNHDG